MLPAGAIRRTRLLPVSPMRKAPSAATATPAGLLSCADFGGPLSPLKPGLPLPATVTINPFGLTRRIRWLSLSAIR
jgi:hypothetical protein